MSLGMILLLVLSLLVIFGVGQRVLDRMHLSDRAALFIMAALFIGGLLPDIRIGNVTVNLGGAVIPFAVSVWVLIKADSGREVARALFGAVVTGLAVYWLGRLMPNEPERIWFDPNYVYGLAGGAIAYLLGRSRRAAFVCGVLGVLGADIAVGVINATNGISQPLNLGTAGALDAAVISGFLAVLLAEFVGEALERITRGRATAPDEDGAISDGRRRQ